MGYKILGGGQSEVSCDSQYGTNEKRSEEEEPEIIIYGGIGPLVQPSCLIIKHVVEVQF